MKMFSNSGEVFPENLQTKRNYVTINAKSLKSFKFIFAILTARFRLLT